MNIVITLISPDKDEEKIHQLSRNFKAIIKKETPFTASAYTETNPIPGEKGDPITIGTIVLTALGTGGAAAALIDVFKSYIGRNKELTIKIKRPDSDEIEISSKNIDVSEIKATLTEILTKP